MRRLRGGKEKGRRQVEMDHYVLSLPPLQSRTMRCFPNLSPVDHGSLRRPLSSCSKLSHSLTLPLSLSCTLSHLTEMLGKCREGIQSAVTAVPFVSAHYLCFPYTKASRMSEDAIKGKVAEAFFYVLPEFFE